MTLLRNPFIPKVPEPPTVEHRSWKVPATISVPEVVVICRHADDAQWCGMCRREREYYQGKK